MAIELPIEYGVTPKPHELKKLPNGEKTGSLIALVNFQKFI
jgi:hypothetical protein